MAKSEEFSLFRVCTTIKNRRIRESRVFPFFGTERGEFLQIRENRWKSVEIGRVRTVKS